MARLIYSVISSLDGYIEDADGSFGWAEPDATAHAFINEQLRPIGTHLYGRRMYETMQAWETLDRQPGQPPVMLEFAKIWQGAEKIVYSTTLDNVTTTRTRLERTFHPDAIRRLKAEAERDLLIGGAALAARAIEAGLVDEYHLFLAPAVVGGGKRALPDGVGLDLELLDERRFDSGIVYLRYAVTACGDARG